MTYIKGKYDEQQFLNALLLSNGNAYMSLYKKTDEHFNYNTVTHQAQESIGTPVSCKKKSRRNFLRLFFEGISGTLSVQGTFLSQ